MCRIEENTNRTTKFHKWTCNLTPLVRNICWKYCGKREKLLLRSNFSSYPQYFVTWCQNWCKTGIRFSLRDKRLFEITEVEITRVDCIIQSTACDCGNNIENTKHYMFECNLYNEQRNALFSSLTTVPNISLDQLIDGSSDFPVETNTTIILAVLKFIKDSGRFKQEP